MSRGGVTFLDGNVPQCQVEALLATHGECHTFMRRAVSGPACGTAVSCRSSLCVAYKVVAMRISAGRYPSAEARFVDVPTMFSRVMLQFGTAIQARLVGLDTRGNVCNQVGALCVRTVDDKNCMVYGVCQPSAWPEWQSGGT